MRADPFYSTLPPDFWAFVKLVSEELGYTMRGSGTARIFSEDEIDQLCRDKHILIPYRYIQLVSEYSVWRADMLNNVICPNLMDAEEAREAFEEVYEIYENNHFSCKLPINKQSGEMKKVNYFTAIINILTEKALTEMGFPHPGFDDDPRSLTYVWDNEDYLVGAASRRFDGAFPSTNNPKIIWEIKEYYYATTFGSRVADGVYETQLDGFEFKEIYDRTGIKVFHVLFIDAKYTWWKQGKSYLCRLLDALNSGLVDEVIVGREVFDRWERVLYDIVHTSDLKVAEPGNNERGSIL